MTTLSDQPTAPWRTRSTSPPSAARARRLTSTRWPLALDAGTIEPSLHEAPTFADLAEIDRFEAGDQGYLAGDLDPEDFRRDPALDGHATASPHASTCT